MKERLYLTVVAAALLIAVTLPIFFSALTTLGGRACGQQTSHQQVARRGADAVCQSSFTCGG
jgi:hypothetical protein